MYWWILWTRHCYLVKGAFGSHLLKMVPYLKTQAPTICLPSNDHVVDEYPLWNSWSWSQVVETRLRFVPRTFGGASAPSSSWQYISFDDYIPGLLVLACRLLVGVRNSNSQPNRLNSVSCAAFLLLLLDCCGHSQLTSAAEMRSVPLGSAPSGSSHYSFWPTIVSWLVPFYLSSCLTLENWSPISQQSEYNWQPSLDSNDL